MSEKILYHVKLWRLCDFPGATKAEIKRELKSEGYVFARSADDAKRLFKRRCGISDGEARQVRDVGGGCYEWYELEAIEEVGRRA